MGTDSCPKCSTFHPAPCFLPGKAVKDPKPWDPATDPIPIWSRPSKRKDSWLPRGPGGSPLLSPCVQVLSGSPRKVPQEHDSVTASSGFNYPEFSLFSFFKRGNKKSHSDLPSAFQPCFQAVLTDTQLPTARQFCPVLNLNSRLLFPPFPCSSFFPLTNWKAGKHH